MRLGALALALALTGCSDGEERGAIERRELQPYPNPFGPSDPMWAPQPRRDHPLELALSQDGSRLYVTLQGVEDEPGNAVAVVDTEGERLLGKIRVGSGPTGLALHPGGRFLVVTNRFSSFASVIDTKTDEVVKEVSIPWYTIDVAFSPDGERAYFTNRWKDSVLSWDLDVGSSFRVVGTNYEGARPEDPMGDPRGRQPTGPGDLARRLTAVRDQRDQPEAGHHRHPEAGRDQPRAPGVTPGDVVVNQSFLLITHTGRGSQHQPDAGFDTDGDGKPGDGTANVMFQDLQNEIMVLDHDGHPLWNYTSDTLCCRDFSRRRSRSSGEGRRVARAGSLARLAPELLASERHLAGGVCPARADEPGGGHALGGL
jgi:YVTN family beta-propeller protein